MLLLSCSTRSAGIRSIVLFPTVSNSANPSRCTNASKSIVCWGAFCGAEGSGRLARAHLGPAQRLREWPGTSALTPVDCKRGCLHGKKCACNPHCTPPPNPRPLLPKDMEGAQQQQHTRSAGISRKTWWFAGGAANTGGVAPAPCATATRSAASQWGVRAANHRLLWATKPGRINIAHNYPTILITCPIFHLAISCPSHLGIFQTQLLTGLLAGKQKTN